uniref:Nicotinic acetylcholine receptor alpha 9 subunit n=1 Tax=Blattella germanica TaxID=6973 RepID=A0A7T6C2B7_BLAGE|nr:nicotinic acetylcholine receptor alpha 9 subunit [Blattella germanica]
MACSGALLLLLYIAFAAAITDNTGTGTLPPRPPGAWNATWTDRLKRDLLLNYDKFARPAQHTNTTTVRLGMTFRHIALDELKAIMTVQGWTRMTWTDEKLKWNESDYGGLGVLHVADHEIWQPDIVLYNSATGNMVDHYGNTHCLAYPNGEVLWVPPSQFQVFCELDLRMWPFDTQTCHLTLGSWTYDGDHVDILLDKHGAEVLELMEMMEWEFVGVEDSRNVKTYACCIEPYIDVTYKLTLRRRSPAYSAIVITPATVIVLMTLVSFWLPPSAGEKILLNGCTALIICIFLLYFSQKLPAMAGHTPLVVLFYSSSLYLVCIATVVSVVVMNLARNFHATPMPWIIKNLLTGWLGHILGLGHLIAQAKSLHHNMMSGHAEELREQQASVFEDHDHMGNSSDDRQMISPRSRASSQHDWVLLAAAIDRIAFLVYSLLFAILAIVYAV